MRAPAPPIPARPHRALAALAGASLALVACAGATSVPSTTPTGPGATSIPARGVSAPATPTRDAARAMPTVQLRAAWPLPGWGDLLQGRADVTWISRDGVHRVLASGLELDPATSATLARELGGIDAPEVRLHRGHGLVLSQGSFASARTVRIDGAGATPTTGNDLVLGVAPLDDGRELWMIALAGGGQQRLALLDASGSSSSVPLPASRGPSVPGLSELAAPHCATPFAARIAGDGESAVVLVSECHVDAPTHLLRLRSGASAPEVRAMPPLGFPPEVMGVLPDGRAVIAGASPPTVAIEQPDGTWSRRPGPSGAVTVVSMAVGSDGAVWLFSLGSGPDGHDRWWIERDGALVHIADPDGAALTPRGLAHHPELGVIIHAAADGRRWLLAER